MGRNQKEVIDNQNRSVALRLRQVRVARGMTQKDAAKMLGINVVTLCHMESGKANPTLATMNGIAKGYGVPLSYFFCDGDNDGKQ